MTDIQPKKLIMKNAQAVPDVKAAAVKVPALKVAEVKEAVPVLKPSAKSLRRQQKAEDKLTE